MRLVSIATFIFILNILFTPLLAMAHDLSHDEQDVKTMITWSDDQPSNGLFQVLHDDRHIQPDLTVGIDAPLDHHCHHTSVIGMATFILEKRFLCVSTFNMIEPIFSIQSFHTLIEYPPKNI